MGKSDLLTIRESVARAREEGLKITEYSLRKWVKSGAVPSRKIGEKRRIYWPNLYEYLVTGDPVPQRAPAPSSKIMPCD